MGRQRRRGGVVGDTRGVEPADGPSVEVRLVDGLRSADIEQLGRPVRGAHEHRHACEVRLDDRRVQLDGGRAARGQHDGGLPRAQGQAQREEAGAALVVVDVDLDAVAGGQRQGHRRRARSGADHRVLDAVAHPLVHERGAEGGLKILGSGRHRAPIRAHAVCQDPRHALAHRAPRPRTAARAGARVHPDLPVLGPGGRRARPRSRADLRRRTRPRAIRHERRQPGGRRPTHRRAGWRGHLRRLLDGRALRAARRPRPRGAGPGARAPGGHGGDRGRRRASGPTGPGPPDRRAARSRRPGAVPGRLAPTAAVRGATARTILPARAPAEHRRGLASEPRAGRHRLAGPVVAAARRPHDARARDGGGSGREVRRTRDPHRGRRSGPTQQLALIEGAGHAAHLEQPDRFLAAIQPWLTDHGL